MCSLRGGLDASRRGAASAARPGGAATGGAAGAPQANISPSSSSAAAGHRRPRPPAGGVRESSPPAPAHCPPVPNVSPRENQTWNFLAPPRLADVVHQQTAAARLEGHAAGKDIRPAPPPYFLPIVVDRAPGLRRANEQDHLQHRQ